MNDGDPEGARRAALAHWITAPDNMLTWRSIVNRVWQYHFGAASWIRANDFGHMGSQPTHPELLDWLAVTFRDQGGRFKQLHKLIVMSAVYRQQSANNAANAAGRRREPLSLAHEPAAAGRRVGARRACSPSAASSI